jgi:hypothetical protein
VKEAGLLYDEYPITPGATTLVSAKVTTSFPPNKIGTVRICAVAEASAYSIFVYAEVFVPFVTPATALLVESCEYNFDNPHAGLSGVPAIVRSRETVAEEKFASPTCSTLIIVVPTATGVICPLAPIVAVPVIEEL